MTLEDCIAAAIENNPMMRSGKIAVQRAKDMQAAAFDLPKTDISLAQTPTTGGGPENALTFSQSFEFPTVYGARRGKLKAETALEEMRYELTRDELSREVATAYCSLVYCLHTKNLLTAQDTLFHHFLSIAEARLKAGETSKLEMINARRLHDDNHIAVEEAKRQVENAQLRLRQWLNKDIDIQPADTALTPIAGIPDCLSNFSAQDSRTAVLASKELALAEKELSLTRQQAYLPDITLGASTQMLIKGFNPYGIERSRFEQGNFMGFEVGLSVPLFWGGKQAAVKVAKHDVETARLRREARMREISTAFAIDRNEYLKARERMDYYEKKAMGDAEETFRLAQVSYEKGDIGYIEFIQNIQAAFSVQTSYAAAVDAYNQAWIKLSYTYGKQAEQQLR